MTKIQKVKKQAQISPFWRTGWTDIDRAFDNLRRDLERSFASFPPMPKMPESTCDVIDEGKQFRIRMDVPGVKKNEVELNVTDNSVEVSAKHKEESEEKKKNYLTKERKQVSFYRTIPLTEKVVSKNAKAKLTDGVLDIIIPKVTPTSKPKKTSISVQ